MIRKFTLDMDYDGGHKSISAAEAIKLSWELLGLGAQDNVSLEFNVGDSGGGAAVQHLICELIRLGVMPKHSIHIRCLLHAMNKVLETACEDAMSTFGMNHHSCWQLCFLVTSLISIIKKKGCSKMVKT